ncbi:MAG: glycosyltransferase family 2 protein [Nitrososphaerota archaeon]
MREVSKVSSADLPSISIVIPTYNEEKNIGKCLDAIYRQNYPLKLVEIIVIDNGSIDETVKIVRSYAEKYENIILDFNNYQKDAEMSKMIGLRKATGNLFLYLDADIEILGNDWLSKMIEPLIKDTSLVGSFPRFKPNPRDTALGRYLRYHPLELDPVLRFFCTEINETVVENKGSYKICEFHPPKIPPIGICIYRREILVNVIGHMEKFMDIDVPFILSKRGFNRFAYVPSCGIYHTNIRGLRDLIKRRMRNLEKVYLPNIDKREFKYFDLSKGKDIVKIILSIIYANIFIPKLIIGLYKALKYRDYALLYEPIVSLVLTDILIYGFLKNKKLWIQQLKKRVPSET